MHLFVLETVMWTSRLPMIYLRQWLNGRTSFRLEPVLNGRTLFVTGFVDRQPFEVASEARHSLHTTEVRLLGEVCIKSRVPITVVSLPFGRPLLARRTGHFTSLKAGATGSGMDGGEGSGLDGADGEDDGGVFD